MLSTFLFIIQCLNFLKFIFVQIESAIESSSQVLLTIILILNLVFDTLPLLIVFIYYKKYYKKANAYREGREIGNSDSLITNEEFWARLRNESD